MSNMKTRFISFDTETEIVDENPDSRFLTAKIQAFSSGKNLHNMICDESILKNTAKTIYNVPVIYNIAKYTNSFGNHVEADKSLIAGFVDSNSAEFVRLDDGRLSLNVRARISKRYSPKVIDILKKESGRVPVSVEMELVDSEELEDGSVVMKDFTYFAVCLLAPEIQPAIPDAHIKVLSFAKENELVKNEYDLEFSNKYYDIDFTIPQKVKDTANKALKSYKEKGINATSVSLAMGRFLSNNEKITPEKIRMMAKFFNRKSVPNAFVMGFYGGQEGAKWSNQMNKSLDEIDKRKPVYFENNGEIITFPYKSLKDVNPALKGIDPPISLAQANAIAKQADAIGTDEKKNGWAISIASFKKTHKVENGRWVKKENMSKESTDDLEEKNLPEKEEKLVDKNKELKEENLSVDEFASNKDSELEDQEENKEEESEKDNEEEDNEEQENEEKSEKENMSLDGNIDVAAMLKILEAETEEYKDLVEKNESGNMDFQKLSTMLYAKICEMSEKADKDKEAYLSENESLKEFKADIEAKQFAFEVEATLSEVSDTMPKDKIAEHREDSKNFSLENIDAWKNKVKAVAFSYAKEKKPSDNINRVAMPWLNSTKSASNFDNGWL